MSEPAGPEIVIVIDDDYAMRLSCQKILSRMGLETRTFSDGACGLEGVAAGKPAMVIVDLKMPGLSGMEVITRVHEIDTNIVIVVITGYATIDTAVQAMKCGAYDFLPKPFSPDELRLIVNRGLERRRLAKDRERHEIQQALLKRRFVTFVSHQLRTPLAAIHQYLDVMRHLEETGKAAAGRSEWLGRCLVRIDELEKLISDWLTLARVEGGTLMSERVEVDLKVLIPGILRTYEPQAAASRVTMEAKWPEDALSVSGDRNCLSMVFDNLITNGIKYNRPGGRVTVVGSRSRGEVSIAVADTGIGIPEQHRPFLFDEFFRVPDEGAKQVAGTGLGLHICKTIVSEMGGTIGVESEAGAGSTFTVMLPAWREPEEDKGSRNDAGQEASAAGR